MVAVGHFRSPPSSATFKSLSTGHCRAARAACLPRAAQQHHRQTIRQKTTDVNDIPKPLWNSAPNELPPFLLKLGEWLMRKTPHMNRSSRTVQFYLAIRFAVSATKDNHIDRVARPSGLPMCAFFCVWNISPCRPAFWDGRYRHGYRRLSVGTDASRSRMQ